MRSKSTTTDNKQSEQLAVLQGMNQRIAAGGATESIMQTALNLMLERLEVQAAQIYLLTRTGKEVWLYLEVGKGRKPVTQTVDIFSVDEQNIISDTVRRQSAVYIPDVALTHYSYLGNLDTISGSEVGLPMASGDNLVGVLRLQSAQRHAFEEADLDYLSNLALLLGTTIYSKRRIDQLEDSIQEIKTLYTLKQQDAMEEPEAGSEGSRTAGYEYDHSHLLKLEPLPDDSPLPERVTTRERNGNRELVAPIQLHGETIGIVGLEEMDGASETWGSDDLRLLEEVSSQVALAIENARLLRQTQEQTKDLTILFEATRQLTETIDLPQIYDILTDHITGYLQADRCTALLLDQSRTHFKSVVAKRRDHRHNILTLATPRTEAVAGLGLFEQMLQEPGLIIRNLKDVELEPETRRYLAQAGSSPIQTLTLLPITVRGQLVGIVEVVHVAQPHVYSTNELQLAQAIISQVTVTVENAQLFQQTQKSLEDTQKLYDISRRLVESTSIEDVFEIILENVRAYNVDRVSISLLDRADKGAIESVTIVASWDSDPHWRVPVGTRFDASNFALVETFARPPFHPLISHDLRSSEQDERMDDSFREFVLKSLGARTMFSAPMFLGEEYKGVLSIYTRTPHIYSNEEIRIYQTLADQGITAIENYRLLQTTRQERDRASLLFRLGQALSRTTTVEQVQQAVIGMAPQANATDMEIFMSDGGDFSALASTIPQRQKLDTAAVERLILENGHEALALSRGQVVQLSANETVPEKWPLHKVSGMRHIKALVCVPFFSQRSTLQGVLSFFSSKGGAFSPEQIGTFEAITQQTAATLENVWLLRHTNQMLVDTALLYNVTRGLNGATSLEDILRVLSEDLPAPYIDMLAIATVSELNRLDQPLQIESRLCWNAEDNEIAATSLQLRADELSFIKKLNAQRPTEIYSSALSLGDKAALAKKLPDVQAILAMPLTVGKSWLGILLMISHIPDTVFQISTISQVSTIAGQVAVVLQNLSLVKETERNLQNSEVLSYLGQQLLAANSEQQIYNLALEAIATTQPEQGATIFMVDEVGGDEEVELVSDWEHPSRKQPALELGFRLSSKELGLLPLLRRGLSVVSEYGLGDDRFSPTLRQLLATMGIEALVAVPIWLKHKIAGFILIGNDSRTPFGRDVVRLYENIAREVSGALDNRRLFDEIEHRAWQLQTAAEVSQAATASLDVDALLFESVELIKERFGFYHASIFLLDAYQRYAVVRASTGEIGQKMLAMNHKLEVGGRSIVGTATATGRPRIALDVGQDAVHFNNPLLPETRSEMALPLSVQGRVIGALDVQSTKRGAFSESDITVLQSMANQLANAIEAAQAYQESHQALDEVSKLHQRYMREQWRKYLNEQMDNIGVQLDEAGQVIEFKVDDGRTADLKIAPVGKEITILENASNSSLTGADATDGSARLIAPLMLQGQSVIGALELEIPAQPPSGGWDDEILPIIEAVSAQAVQAIEEARLYEQSQVAREEAEALYEVGRSLVTQEDETEMFNTVLGKMLETLGLPQGGVLLFNPDGKSGRLYALYRDGKRVDQPDLEFPVADNLSYQKLIETRRPVAIEDMGTDPLVARVREMGLVGNIASLLLVPLVIGDEVVGALGADSVGRRHRFTPREVNVAMAMADQLAIAVQNRRLIAETQRRATLLQTSAEVGRVATSILDEDAMIDQMVTRIREGFEVHVAQIYLMDSLSQFMMPHKHEKPGPRERIAVGGDNVVGQAAARRKSIVRRYPTADSSVKGADGAQPLVRVELAIPLQVGKTVVGVVNLQRIKISDFTQEETSTLETLAAQLAVAIQNARAFKEQQQIAERLKEIDKLKTQFLANMSHELRTPLNSIIGFSRVILKGIDGPLTELQKADLTSIYNSGQHLLGLINNILDLSKIEAGKMELHFEETDLVPIIKTVMSTAVALVKDKPVELRTEVPDDIPYVWADPTRLRQIILNLVSNACKFTAEGTVTTYASAEDGKVVISVTDTGIGIPAEKLDHIFEEFTQVDGSTTRKVGGTGLGLPISRHFVEMHRGQIWVEGGNDGGTSFKFSVPTSPPSTSSKRANGDAALAGPNKELRTVLAIDDDSGVVDLYRRYLESQNYEVIGVSSGREALKKVKEHRPYAVLLDIVIPEKDGWQVMKELKEDPFTRNIPVIICSIVGDKHRGFSMGASDYLVKPIVESELLGALVHLDTEQEEGVKVLVVDDQADDILLMRRIMQAHHNFTIFEASNGEEGLAVVEKEAPDLIILDLNMPRMDGFAMLEALKADETTRGIPIIIVSAQELSQAEQDKLTGQVEVLLRKGIFTENELLEDIGMALERLGGHETATR